MTISVPARPTRSEQWAVAALVGAVLLVHVAAAARRSSGLLEHDESIAVLTAAGQMPRLLELQEAGSDGFWSASAAELQALLHPAAGTTTSDVLHSLLHRDQHPPLYFLVLRGLLYLDRGSPFWARLFGTAAVLTAAWAANRWIWPAASAGGRWLGLAWLAGSVVMVETATELRQYALVMLGTTLSVAAWVLWWEDHAPRHRVVLLLTLAPVLLLWTHYAAVVWVAVGLVAMTVCLACTGRRRWPMPAAAMLIGSLFLSPLVMWRLQSTVELARVGNSPPADCWREAVLPLSQGVQEAWLPLPWLWRSEAMSLGVAAALLLVLAALAARAMPTADRVLLAAAFVWGGLWLLLLQRGQVPVHAVKAKYLAPLLMVPLALLVRAVSASRPRWAGRAAIAVLLASVAANAAALRALLGSRPEAPLLAGLAGTRCLLTDSLSRGYVLPLVEKLPPDATVLVVPPGRAEDCWPEVSSRLPEHGLTLVEVHRLPHAPRTRDWASVVERLSLMYERREQLWSGPRRTIMTFSGRRASSAADGVNGPERSSARGEGERPGV